MDVKNSAASLLLCLSCATSRQVQVDPQTLPVFERKSFAGALFLEAIRRDELRQDSNVLLASAFEVFPDAVVASKMVEKLLHAGKTIEAMVEAEKKLLLFPSSADLFLVKGKSEHRLGKYKAARNSFLTAIKHNPNLKKVYPELYLLHVSLSEFSSANRYAEEWYRYNPTSFAAAMTVGRIRFHAGRFEEALEAAESAHSINYKRPDAMVLAGFSASRLRQQQKADDYFRRAYVLDPLNEEIFSFLEASSLQKNDPKKLIDLIDQVIAGSKHDSRLRSSLQLQKAFFYWSLSRPDRAQSALKSAIAEIDSEIEKGLLRSYGYEKMNRLDLALKVLEGLSPSDKELDFVLLRQGLVSLQMKKVTESMRFLGKISEKNRGLRYGLIKASALESLGKSQDAIQLVTDIVRRYPRSPEAMYSLGYLYGQNEQVKDAIKVMEHLVNQHPGFADAYNYLGLLNARSKRKGHLQAAMTLIRVARGLAPRDPYYMDSEGWILFQSGDREAGLRLIEQAFLRGGSVVEIGKHYFVALQALGRVNEAKMVFNSLLEKGLLSKKEYEKWKKMAELYNA